MCGIAGWFSTGSGDTRHDAAMLEKMVMCIAHRGPDAQNTLVRDAARLGHVRLSIIDLESGAQPLTTQCGQASIIFNGEIYNYQQLRQDLVEKGVNFSTHSDTEVIVNLYVLEGPQGFAKLRGMFAFAIWDSNAEKGFLVRDWQGIKPLFYTRTVNNDLTFASEAKAITARHPHLARLNENTLHGVMNFRYVMGEESMFRDIRQVAPGEIVEWNREGVNLYRLPEQNAIDHGLSIEETLADSVAAHLEADVPVGAYLSGGVDSALITKLALNHKHSIQTFTLDVGDSPLEAQHARESANILGVSNFIGSAGVDVEKRFCDLIWHLETPKVNSLQVYNLAELAAQHQKVVLSGLGADELFLGYNIHQLLYFGRGLRFIPGQLRRGVSSFLSRALSVVESDPWSEKSRAIDMLRMAGNWPAFYGVLRNVWDSPTLRSQIYGERMLDAGLRDCGTMLSESWPADQKDPLIAAQKWEYQNKLVNDLLWQEDRCSMAHGLEVRVPFVDGMLSRRMKSVSIEQLMKYGQKKYLLKKIAKSYLPDSILKRPKSGFQVDSPTFFQESLTGLANTYLSPDSVKRACLFNPRFVEQLRSLPHKKRYRWHFFMLYLMIGAHVWLDVFEQGKYHSWKT